LVQGENPYDVDRVGPLEYQAGRDKDEQPILMWNPPWTLPLVAPLGYLDARAAHLLWLLVQLLAALVAADRLWVEYGGCPENRLLGVLLGLVFVPTLMALVVGQISPLLLLGAVGFLAFEGRRRDLLAGASAA